MTRHPGEQGAPGPDAPVPGADGPPAATRRTFVDWILALGTTGLLGTVLYPVVRYIYPPPSAEASVNSVTLSIRTSDIPSNSGTVFKFGNRPGLIVRTPAGELRAFSARCTHLDCTVQYRDDVSRIWCACHNGYFDLNGRNVAGPPPRPLESFQVRLRGDEIVVTRSS